jgi:glucosyl-3-phosphoglycerate synthase
VEQLKGARYVDRIILSLDKADERQFRHVKDVMRGLPAQVSILWNDGPAIKQVLETLEENGFNTAEQGKGRGVWMAMGYALTDKRVRTLALHDCDIVNYTRELLARLVYPIVHPGTDFEFAKGYYARVTDRLHGRVARLFFTPLVRAVQRICGPMPFFEFLDSFRYPLSGEFAFIRSLATGIRISPSWGLEMSLLGEVFDNSPVQRVCQVQIAENYEHKHQKLVEGDYSKGLGKMAVEIANTLFGLIAQGGITVNRAEFRTLMATYERYARMAIESYNAVALMNGLTYDRDKEIIAVETFIESIREAAQLFLDDPTGVPMMNSWVRVRAGLPEVSEQLRSLVDAENEVPAVVPGADIRA